MPKFAVSQCWYNILGSYCMYLLFQVYVLKRPYVDEFLKKMGELFECVLFTASLAKVGISCIRATHWPVTSQGNGSGNRTIWHHSSP